MQGRKSFKNMKKPIDISHNSDIIKFDSLETYAEDSGLRDSVIMSNSFPAEV